MKEIKKEKEKEEDGETTKPAKNCLLFYCPSALLFSSARFGRWVNKNEIFYNKERTFFHQKRM